jgi:hypothetical protein
VGNTQARVRRRPEESVLYQVVQQHLQTFCARVAAVAEDDAGRSALPDFVERGLHAFLDCGVLARGFCRLHCDACGRIELVAFSCKKRGFCPSCCARRMADTAAFLVDEVLPDVPVRQWVLSLPHRVRLLCACDPAICRAVRAILVRTVSNFYLREARRLCLPRPRIGAVVVDQRFDSAARLDVHYHSLFVDGVFTCGLGQPRADFHAARDLTDADVARIVRRVRDFVLRLLRRRGKLPAEDAAADDPDPGEADLLQQIHAAAVQGRTAFGPTAGTPDARPGRGTLQVQFRHGEGSLCADLDGFSLHAAVRVEAGRPDRLEHLIRYLMRPPLAEERLHLLPDGRVAIALKKRWRDGTASVVLDPLTFLERLAALIPRPHRKTVNYYGVFAAAAAYRSRVVPPPPVAEPRLTAAPHATTRQCSHAPEVPEHQGPACATAATARSVSTTRTAPPASAVPATADDPATAAQLPLRPTRRTRNRGVPHAPRKRPKPRRYYFWHELLRRVFLHDVLVCTHCGGDRRLLTFLTDQNIIRKILRHLGLPAEPPALAPPRPPPGRTVEFRRY